MLLPQEAHWSHPLFERIACFIVDESTADFETLAFELVTLQYQHIPVYQRLCQKRGWSPEIQTSYQALPALHADYFKQHRLHCFPEQVTQTFMTSGTSKGVEHKGKCLFSEDDMRLMQKAIFENATRYFVSDPEYRDYDIYILAPEPQRVPYMIMAYGMQQLIQHFGSSNSSFFVGSEGLELPRLLAALDESCQAGRRVVLMGSSSGFDALVKALQTQQRRFELPAGSVVLDAGGFKNQQGHISEAALHDAMVHCFGIIDACHINLLGMTELASQFYGQNLYRYRQGESESRLKANPHWTRSWVVDPETLAPLPQGEAGILIHLDLANGGHPCVIQTQDCGVAYLEGFEILSRDIENLPKRGCSLSFYDAL